MPTLKRELTSNDLTVLHYYADNGMRERYWNYLANHQTNDITDADKYGELALSVVRNDSMPGRIANKNAIYLIAAQAVSTLAICISNSKII